MSSCALEVTVSMDASSFLQAFLRFAARRGMPRLVFSDNGTNLVGARRQLQKELRDMDQSTLRNLAAQNGMLWEFSPRKGSHFGGVGMGEID